jgi:hypothetical protein
MFVARSVNGLPIRLTDERWEHILEEHGELTDLTDRILNTISRPERILLGNDGAMIAVRETEPGKWLVVVYRELEKDGFVITAFLTRRRASLNRRKQLWP